MFKKSFKLMLLGLALVLVLAGCNGQQAVEEVVNFEIVSSLEVPAELEAWYNNNYEVAGLHSYELNGEKYLILSVGEKPTGGYSIENIKLIGTKEEIAVNAKLKVPAKDEMVTEALTYPHALLKIVADGRELKFGGIDNADKEVKIMYKIDSGTYTGRADMNFIEIRISGVQPDEKAYRVFRLNEELRETFDEYGIEEGDQVKFSYYDDENGQGVIVSIVKL